MVKWKSNLFFLFVDLCFIMALVPFSIVIILSHIPFNNQPQHRTYNTSFGFSYENKISCIMDWVHFLIVHFSLIMDEIHSSSCSLAFINEVIYHCYIFLMLNILKGVQEKLCGWWVQESENIFTWNAKIVWKSKNYILKTPWMNFHFRSLDSMFELSLKGTNHLQIK